MQQHDTRYETVAKSLLAAERSRVAVERPGGLELQEAYRIQGLSVAHRLAEGARRVGHKVGLTSKAMQKQMGLSEPDSGVLLDDMVLPDDSVLEQSAFLAPRVEAEIAFRLGCDLVGPHVDVQDARDAVSLVCVALEVIDTRFGDWGISVADSIADNASCARVITGAMVPLNPMWDLAAEQVTVSVNGKYVAAGEGRALLGNPFIPLVWLARRLYDVTATGLRAGDLVLAGAVHASLPIQKDMTVQARAAHLPPVRLRVT